MAREVIESGKIVIRSDCGNRMEVQGKCDAAMLMLTAFKCLPEGRRAALLLRMQAAHSKLLAEEPRNG